MTGSEEDCASGQEEIIKARSMESTTRIGTFRAEEIDFTWLTVLRGTQVYRWNRS